MLCNGNYPNQDGAVPAAAPLELAAVLVLVSLELGPAAAFAGIATMLAVIPIQARCAQDI